MGCQSDANIGENLTFSITTHDPDTGVLTDADAAPAYRIYENETAVPILTGTMDLLDAVNTTGFYAETIAVSLANGFEDGKSYTIYITATVDGDTGGICYGFRARTATNADVADAIWDEILTSGTHNVAYSAGYRLRCLVLRQGQAQGGSTNSITLAAAESATNHIFNENIISLISGTGAGQTRLISEYDGGTKVAIVDKPWFTAPNATTFYEILPFSSIMLLDHGIAQAGAATSITLATTASATNDMYIGSVVYISSGTGLGQVRLITDYDGGTKVATVTDAWTTNPDVTSVYKVLPVGRVIVESLSAAAGDAIAADVWTYSPRTLTQAAAAVAAAVAGASISITRGDSLSVALTGLGSLAGYVSIDFTVKQSKHDTDDNAIIRIRKNASGLTDGLLRLNRADASLRSANGSITINSEPLGNITIALTAAETDDLAIGYNLYYDVQMITAAAVTTKTEGHCSVTADVTRLIA